MTKDIGESKELARKPEILQPEQRPVGEIGKESMQGPAQKLEWTAEDQALLDEVQRLQEQQNAELEAEIRRLREVELQRRLDRQQDILRGKKMSDEGTVE